MSTVPAAADLAKAVSLLQRGDLVAFPTETVYGLGADARSPAAVRKIFKAKGRPADHPLIVHLADGDDLLDWGQPNTAALALADAFWPGPLTLVMRRQPTVTDVVTGGRNTVGVRVPRHPVAQALLRDSGCAVGAPSANRFGRVSPTRAAHVLEELPEVFVLDGGPCAVGVESTIVDVSAEHPALLRPGGVPVEAIEAVVGPLGRSDTVAPGTLAAHYAPRTRLELSEEPEVRAAVLRSRGLRVSVLEEGTLEVRARRLYAELRRLDSEGTDVLLARPAPEHGLGRAINDRLARAVRGSGEAADG